MWKWIGNIREEKSNLTHLRRNLIHYLILHFYDFLSIVDNVRLIRPEISLIYSMKQISIVVIVELLVSIEVKQIFLFVFSFTTHMFRIFL